VLDDLAAITDLGLPVKVILEMGRLDPEALALLVEISIDAGARYLKTGSGFGPTVTAAQVAQLVGLARGRAAVKAAGGITDLEQALALVAAGAGRLGTSRGVALMQALRAGA
jgi:deoxyribose-phosphate aldolase